MAQFECKILDYVDVRFYRRRKFSLVSSLCVRSRDSNMRLGCVWNGRDEGTTVASREVRDEGVGASLCVVLEGVGV